MDRIGLTASLFFGFWVKYEGSLTKMCLGRPVRCPELISGKARPVPETSCFLAELSTSFSDSPSFIPDVFIFNRNPIEVNVRKACGRSHRMLNVCFMNATV